MSLHIGAQPGDIAETVLISGDPLRAKYVAEQMLTEVVCYNQVRGMLGFTGYYNGKRVSVQGTGMGIPSTAIYVHELIQFYKVKRLIRIGTCGALQPSLELGQLILAQSAYTDSATHLSYFSSYNQAAPATESLRIKARQTAQNLNLPALEGAIFSTDIFYSEAPERWTNWIAKGVLGVEMESSILYAMAAASQVEALSVLTVSDNIITQTATPAHQREQASRAMMQLALEIA